MSPEFKYSNKQIQYTKKGTVKEKVKKTMEREI
jgi:hypothetical protein